jgi:mannose-6-phosphate isomerase-like protein (cupin superfamily)
MSKLQKGAPTVSTKTTPRELALMTDAAALLLARPSVSETIRRLKREVVCASDAFVWATVELTPTDPPLPQRIRSCWIFVLKPDTGSGAHFHPNSVQHMTVIEGFGRSRIGGAEAPIARADWVVIPEGVPHEFFPEGSAMVVMSFHTCSADELEEIGVASGQSRRYA